jgi:hypothetical protein
LLKTLHRHPHQENPGFHVEYAGPHRLSGIDPKRPLLNLARRPHCVGVAEEKNSLL